MGAPRLLGTGRAFAHIAQFLHNRIDLAQCWQNIPAIAQIERGAAYRFNPAHGMALTATTSQLPPSCTQTSWLAVYPVRSMKPFRNCTSYFLSPLGGLRLPLIAVKPLGRVTPSGSPQPGA